MAEPAEMSASTVAQPASRYVVGIDLGTTNSAVGFVDTHDSPWRVQTLAVEQLTAFGQVEARETLPSFHYEATEAESAADAFRLPWSGPGRRFSVGTLARDHGASAPGRTIASAKSWLCHGGVDRTAALLPWHADPDVQRLSPLEASSRYLGHLRDAWNHRHPDDPLEAQDVVVTLPASFDEIARELTVRAARQAGLPRIVLIEEPQAAFYAWIDTHGATWDHVVAPGQKILVCDIGGGTTDFTLIRVRAGDEGRVRFHRVAVGEHLLLGGDNCDLALAHAIEPRLTGGGRLEPRHWDVLVRTCRHVKETLLTANAPESMGVHLAGGGARLIGGGLQTEIQRAEVEELLVQGFLPNVALDDRPVPRRSGFQELGLPFAADAAITRYLAAFLSTHRHAGDLPDDAQAAHDPARPDAVLFNGGFFNSPLLAARLLAVVESWFNSPGSATWKPLVLRNERLDLAVAHGAAYYGMVRRGEGVRVTAGLARTYYVGVAVPDGDTAKAVCLLPAGTEEGHDVHLAGQRFQLALRQPVEFPLFVSSTRLTDPSGQLIAVDPEQMFALPPIRTVLHAARRTGEAEQVAVELHARLSEIGTLELGCRQVDSPQSWRLEFDVRAATQTDREGHQGAAEAAGIVDETVVAAGREVIRVTFAPTAHQSGPKPDGLVKSLEAATGLSRRDWPPSLLRSFWDTLMQVEAGRRQSAVHEARWLNLLGFSLRPGYGLAVDDWRVAQTWKLFQGKKLWHPVASCQVEWLVLWRRLAGGLSAGQQLALAEPLLATVRAAPKNSGSTKRYDRRAAVADDLELWRLLGSLELLAVPLKIDLGRLAVARLTTNPATAQRDALAWVLGRLGSRVPVYGPLNTVVPVETTRAWIDKLLAQDTSARPVQLALVLLARRTGDRYRDVDDALRKSVLKALQAAAANEHFLTLVREGGDLQGEEHGLVFGESLPAGLRIG
ncbi:MAG: hsp70 family protein [Pirellulales bacterium]|nr:hsp70 family protein [Pirellulales bacterium]